MLVLDASAALEALIGRAPDAALVRLLAADGDLHAPHLFDLEVLHALRRLVAAGELTADRAEDARGDIRELTVVRYPHEPLAERIWQLRHTVTVYDAAYVALAEALDVPLATCDARLARAPGHHARIELFGSQV